MFFNKFINSSQDLNINLQVQNALYTNVYQDYVNNCYCLLWYEQYGVWSGMVHRPPLYIIIIIVTVFWQISCNNKYKFIFKAGLIEGNALLCFVCSSCDFFITVCVCVLSWRGIKLGQSCVSEFVLSDKWVIPTCSSLVFLKGIGFHIIFYKESHISCKNCKRLTIAKCQKYLLSHHIFRVSVDI